MRRVSFVDMNATVLSQTRPALYPVAASGILHKHPASGCFQTRFVSHGCSVIAWKGFAHGCLNQITPALQPDSHPASQHVDVVGQKFQSIKGVEVICSQNSWWPLSSAESGVELSGRWHLTLSSQVMWRGGAQVFQQCVEAHAQALCAGGGQLAVRNGVQLGIVSRLKRGLHTPVHSCQPCQPPAQHPPRY